MTRTLPGDYQDPVIETASTPPGQATLLFNKGTLTIDGESNPSGRIGGNDWKFDPRIGRWVCDARDYYLLDLTGVNDKAKAWGSVSLPDQHSLHPLRDAQKEAIKGWLPKKRGVVIKPTGAGKTQVALHLIHRLKITTLIVAPTIDIMIAWKAEIMECLGYECGVVGDGEHRPLPLTVTTYASACIHMETLGNKFGCIFWDEVHHLEGEYRAEAARMSMAPYRLGLTATPPAPADRAKLIDLVGEIAYEQRIEDAVGISLAHYDTIQYPVSIPLVELRRFKRMGRILSAFKRKRARALNRPYDSKSIAFEAGRGEKEAKKMLRLVYQRKEILEGAESKLNMIETLFLRHRGVPCIVWAGNMDMARKIATRFLIPVMSGECDTEERSAIVRKFSEGKYHAVVACKLMTEGTDVPTAKLGIVVGGSGTETDAIQRLGRLLRITGNERALLYDVHCVRTSDEKRAFARSNNSTYNFRDGMKKRPE